MEESASGDGELCEGSEDKSLNATAAPFIPRSSSTSARPDSQLPSALETTVTFCDESLKGMPSAKKQERKPQKGPKQIIDAQALLGFHYERPNPNGAFTSPPQARRQKRNRGYSLSKAEYVQANFRFVVSPLADPFEAAWFHPDVLIPWDVVECVSAPLNQENSLLCPICLDLVHCPRITKCGHTFCVTCLLRHMASDRSNALKCPMCMEYICRKDLRSVRFQSSDLMVIEDAASSNKEQKLQVHSKYTFQHVVVVKGNLTPKLPRQYEDEYRLSNTSSTASSKAVGNSSKVKRVLSQRLQELAKALPSETCTNAQYSRIMYREVPEIFLEYQRVIEELQYHRLRCISEGDVEHLPFLDQALGLHEEKHASFLNDLHACEVDIDVTGTLPASSDQSLSTGTAAVDEAAATTTVSMYNVSLDYDSEILSHLYQATSGENIYLQPLCYRCLATHCKEENLPLPETITAKVIDIERLRIARTDVKAKPGFVRHLPQHAEVILVEIEVKPMVSKKVYAQFETEFHKRQMKRKEAKRKESKMNKDAAARNALDAVVLQQRLASYHQQIDREIADVRADLMAGPTLQKAYGSATGADNNDDSNNEVAEESSDSTEQVSVRSTSASNNKWATGAGQPSIAEVTQMHGHFPTLGKQQSQQQQHSSNSNNMSNNRSRNIENTVATNSPPPQVKRGAWGKPVVAAPAPAPVISTAVVNDAEEVQDNLAALQATRGQVKGNKKVSLFSNTSARSYR